MKIYCNRDEIRRLHQERAAYVEEYNRRKALYDAQKGVYDEAYSEYEHKIIDEVKALLAKELEALPGVKLDIKDAKSWSSDYGFNKEEHYGLHIRYKSPKNPDGDTGRTWRNIPVKKGFSWSIFISWIDENTSWGEEPRLVFNKNPEIYADMLVADDYDILVATYNLFAKIATIDWETLIERITREVPKYSKMVTETDPGPLNTSQFDSQLSKQHIEDFVGKDIWIKVNYYKTGNTTYPDKNCYIKLLRQGSTPAYYDGYLLTGWSWNYNVNNDKIYITSRDFDRLRTCRIRKNGIQPVQPMEIYTTEELFVFTDET